MEQKERRKNRKKRRKKKKKKGGGTERKRKRKKKKRWNRKQKQKTKKEVEQKEKLKNFKKEELEQKEKEKKGPAVFTYHTLHPHYLPRSSQSVTSQENAHYRDGGEKEKKTKNFRCYISVKFEHLWEGEQNSGTDKHDNYAERKTYNAEDLDECKLVGGGGGGGGGGDTERERETGKGEGQKRQRGESKRI